VRLSVGVLGCDIDARSNRVVVTASTKLDPSILVARLRKSGKQAELWPEQPAPPSESQGQESKSQNDGQGKPDEKPGPDNAEAAEPSNPQPSSEPKQSNAGDTPKSAPESKEASNAGEEDTAAAEQHEAKGKAKQQPVHARVTVEYDPRGGDSYMPPPQPIMGYNMARPSPSASYYAAPPAPMARPGPSQGYIDEHYTPSYYGRSSSPYEQPYYYPPQPSPSAYPYQPAASSEDYYSYSAPTPQRSAFSPPRDGYGDVFDDENANSCTVM
jgi:hypothetical protein